MNLMKKPKSCNPPKVRGPHGSLGPAGKDASRPFS